MEAWQYAKHAHQVGEAIGAMIEAMGMMAENKQREVEGGSMAYTEKDFIELIEDRDLGYNALIEKAREFY